MQRKNSTTCQFAWPASPPSPKYGPSATTVWRDIRGQRGERLPIVRVGKRVLVRIEDAERFYATVSPHEPLQSLARHKAKKEARRK